MTYDPNGTRKRRRMTAPKYELVRRESEKKDQKPLIQTTYSPK